MLSDDQRSEFERSGLLRLTDVFTATDAERMCERVWDWLAAERGIRRDDPATWSGMQITGLQALTRARVFAGLGSPTLIAAVDELLGANAWMRPKRWGAPLVSFPDHGRHWDVPGSQWHLDFPARGQARPLFAVRVLAFLAPVEPGCGGTLALTGSHRLIDRLAASGAMADGEPPAVRGALMYRDAWLRDLFAGDGGSDRVQRFMVDGAVIDDVPLRVVELHGRAGPGLRDAPLAVPRSGAELRYGATVDGESLDGAGGLGCGELSAAWVRPQSPWRALLRDARQCGSTALQR